MLTLGGWTTVAEVPADETLKFKVEELENKKQYKFRVSANNKIGQSEPGYYAKVVLAKDPWGKCRLRNTLRFWYIK